MNKYSNYKKIFALMNTFLTYLFSACVIFNMNTVWMHCPQSVIVKEILLIILGSSIIVGVLLNLRNNARKILYAIITISLISLYFVVFKYLNKQTLMSDFYYYWISIIFIVLYVLFVEKSMKDTMKKMDDVILLIAIISLLFWLFGSVMHLVHPNGSVFSYWTDADAPSYYNLYFETQRGAFFGFDNVIIRNTAIFTEAPMSSLVFSTAFISELFLVKSKQICRHVILLIAIITTFSTSGYSVVVLAIAIIAMMKIFGSQNIKLKKAVKKIGVLFIFVSIIAFIFLYKDKLSTSSGMTRLDDFFAGYKAWRDHLIIGNGIGTNSYKAYISEFRITNVGFSNSPMMIFSDGGLYIGLLYFVPCLLGCGSLIREKKTMELAFYLLFLYMFVITVIPYVMLTFYIVISLAKEFESFELKERY